MPVLLGCESCGVKLKVAEKYLGKSIKCPKCGERIDVANRDESDSFSEDDGFSFDNAPPLPPVSRSARAKTNPVQEEPSVLLPSIIPTWRRYRARSGNGWLAVAVSIGLFAAGYFAGREHLKYQIAQGLQKMGEAFAAGLGKQLNPETVAAASGQDPEPKATVPETAMNFAVACDGFALTLQQAQVDHVALKTSISDTTGTSENEQLAFTLLVRNTHDRKILHFTEGNMFLAGHFVLHDDAGNQLRGINFGIHKVVGALTDTSDIRPGDQATHLEVFEVPPPKTEHLILTVNLKAFGSEGVVKFRINANEITGFNQ